MSRSSSTSDNFFTLDPHFPKRLLGAGTARTLNCISHLIEEYSKRSLTVPTDRCVAISALENCIKNALSCQSRYGIFPDFLHRNLLWRADRNKLEKIEYDLPLPSWSWMAYSGGVIFINVLFGEMEWNESLRFDEKSENAIIANLCAFRDCTSVHCGSQYEVRDLDGGKKEQIIYDAARGDILDEDECVVVGKRVHDIGYEDNSSQSDDWHILVVRSTGVDGEYRRVGAGTIHGSHVARQSIDVRVV
jgi:hypothetical protein